MAPGTLSNTMPDMRALLAGGIDARVCTMAAPPYGRMGFIKDEICRNVRTAEANMRLLACPLKACMNRFVLFPTSGFMGQKLCCSCARAPTKPIRKEQILRRREHRDWFYILRLPPRFDFLQVLWLAVQPSE